MTLATKPVKVPPSEVERAYVKYGADVANDVLALIDRTQQPGWGLVKTGLPALDKLVTIAPQTVTVFAGRPGMGKSLWLKVLSKQSLAEIASSGGHDRGERVFYVTLEEPGAKLGVQLGGMTARYRDIVRATADVNEARREATALALALRSLVLIEHPGVLRGAITPAISTSMVIRAIERAHHDDGLTPKMILLDYLQLMQADGSSSSVKSKMEAVTAASNGAVILSRAFNCPVILAVQAGRGTDRRDVRIPALEDMQWASAIEQDAHNIFGLWRPWVDFAESARNGTAKPLVLDGVSLEIVSTLMVMGILKSKDDPAVGRRIVAHLDPAEFRAYPITASEASWSQTFKS
jgi:replicative DNA helicase